MHVPCRNFVEYKDMACPLSFPVSMDKERAENVKHLEEGAPGIENNISRQILNTFVFFPLQFIYFL